uniref:TLC domain-containing protein n=1 Tax=viral metagenome TaxID=1070528 RepID=A0A6C0HDY1_9ZZZZ
MSDTIIKFVNWNDVALNIQNGMLFLLSVSSLFSCLYYNINSYYSSDYALDIKNVSRPFDLLMPFVTIHAFTDLFLTKSTDLKIHHFSVLGVLFYNYYYNVSETDRFPIIYSLLKTEISSIFYVLKYWLPKNTLAYDINSALFYLGFLKFRIIDLYFDLVNNSLVFDIINKYSSSNIVLSSVLFGCCYGLYLLNLYWFVIINKILYKGIDKILKIGSDEMCHYICSYTLFANIPIAFIIYSYNKNEKYIFDVAGVTGLSVASYIYHRDMYNRHSRKELENYEIPDKNNIFIFLNDNAFIHLRSFLTLVTSYYNHKFFLSIIFISSLSHVLSFYNIIITIFQHHIVDSLNNKSNFFKEINTLMILPVVLDVSLVFFNSPYEIGIPFILTSVLMGLFLILDPFYKMTHVGFHALLLLQNYYLCLSHSSVSNSITKQHK